MERTIHHERGGVVDKVLLLLSDEAYGVYLDLNLKAIRMGRPMLN